MKKLFLSILACAMLTGCTSAKSHQETNAASAASADETVQITNAITLEGTPSSMAGYKWIGDDKADYYQISLKESLRFFSEKGSGILYYGYVGCQWCERAIPELNKVAKRLGVTVYYIDAAVKPADEDFKAATDYMDSILSKNDEGKAEFYVPLIVGVKNGEIMGSHESLVSSFKIENESSQMNEKQKAELQGYYEEIIRKCAD